MVEATDPLTGLTAAREQSVAAAAALQAAVDRARAAGHSWREIGAVLQTTRQAAFQRFGRPVDPRTNKPMTWQTLPGAEEKAIEILGCIIEGRWEDDRRDFGEKMLEAVSANRIALAWTQTVAHVAGYERMGEPLAYQVSDMTVVDLPLFFDARGLIDGLRLAAAPTQAAPPVPATWAAVEKQVEQAAPQTRLLVASVSGGACRPIQAVGATTPAPLGSAFKLYVLDALARAIAAGTVGWDQRLTLTSQLKSLPSGELSTEPAGTQLTVLQAAEDMISSSDNTAADLLINLVGRTAVEAAAAASGMAEPALDTPFLTTRELFVLKLDDWPALADRYLALDSAGRLAMLSSTVDHASLPTLAAATAWTTPRDIGSIEWLASPADICKVYASLAALARQPGLAPVASILEINNGGLGLDPRQWQQVWFKGGSEPGVVTLNYLATTRGGRSYLVSVMAANPTAPISAAATARLLAAIKGAFGLAAG